MQNLCCKCVFISKKKIYRSSLIILLMTDNLTGQSILEIHDRNCKLLSSFPNCGIIVGDYVGWPIWRKSGGKQWHRALIGIAAGILMRPLFHCV